MGQLTTHVLDTMNGCPAASMLVGLYRVQGDVPVLIKQLALNHDGRADVPMLDESNSRRAATACCSRWRLFQRAWRHAARTAIHRRGAVDFGMSNPLQHYHVPLLVSPWSYSTYRGS